LREEARPWLAFLVLWTAWAIVLALIPTRIWAPTPVLRFGGSAWCVDGAGWRLLDMGWDFRDCKFGIAGSVSVDYSKTTRYLLIENTGRATSSTSVLDPGQAREWLLAHGSEEEIPPDWTAWRVNADAVVFSVLLAALAAALSLWLRRAPGSWTRAAGQGLALAFLLAFVGFPVWSLVGQPAPPLGLIPPPLALALTLLAVGFGCAVWRRARASHTTSSDG